jgi:hypothetical protein
MPADTRPNEAEINLSALDCNVAQVRSRIRPETAIIASVKANAYGHGIVPVARRLTDLCIEVLATGSIADAIAMRDAGISTPILMMGAALPSAVPVLLRNGLIPTVHCQELADEVVKSAARRTPIYVKVDCGFGRLGIPLRDADRFVLDLARHPRIEIATCRLLMPTGCRSPGTALLGSRHSSRIWRGRALPSRSRRHAPVRHCLPESRITVRPSRWGRCFTACLRSIRGSVRQWD